MFRFFFYTILAITSWADSIPFKHCSNQVSQHIVVKDLEWGSSSPDFYALNVTAHTDQALWSTGLEVQASVLGIHLPGYQIQLCNQTTHPGSPCANGDFSVGLHVDKSVIQKYLPGHMPVDVQLTILGTDSNTASVSSCVEAQVVPATGLVSSCAYLQDNHYSNLFAWWNQNYPGQVTSETSEMSFGIFQENTDAILEHNGDCSQTFTMGHNQFSHLTNEMYQEYLGLRKGVFPKKTVSADYRVSSTPDSVDWRSSGAVTDVKNQGQCGSCWSFSTTGAIEGAYAIKYGKLVSFSEQELVDCDSTDNGCNGGLMDNAFNWIKAHHGLCSDASYPYTSGSGEKDGKCRTCRSIKNSVVHSIVDVDSTEAALQEAVAKQPVSIAIEADKLGFQLYRSGIYSGNCGQNLDHGVLVVGYGDGYWLVKNSWGETWGDEGYIKIAKGNGISGGECGILLSASYPVL